MAARHDPGLERRPRGVGRKHQEGLVLEDDARAGASLILQRPTEDAAAVLLVEAPRALQLVVETGRLDPDRIQLRVRVLERGAGWTAVVVEDQDVLEGPVAGVMLVAVDIRLDDLLHLVPGQRRGGRLMVGTADQHLAGTNGIALPEAPLAMLLAIRLGTERGVQVRHHADRPAL